MTQRTTSAQDRPSVCAIVLNYNGKDVTLETLASLSEVDYPAMEVVVVDNGSNWGIGTGDWGIGTGDWGVEVGGGGGERRRDLGAIARLSEHRSGGGQVTSP